MPDPLPEPNSLKERIGQLCRWGIEKAVALVVYTFLALVLMLCCELLLRVFLRLTPPDLTVYATWIRNTLWALTAFGLIKHYWTGLKMSSIPTEEEGVWEERLTKLHLQGIKARGDEDEVENLLEQVEEEINKIKGEADTRIRQLHDIETEAKELSFEDDTGSRIGRMIVEAMENNEDKGSLDSLSDEQ